MLVADQYTVDGTSHSAFGGYFDNGNTNANWPVRNALFGTALAKGAVQVTEVNLAAETASYDGLVERCTIKET
jgi:hypothetical protein